MKSYQKDNGGVMPTAATLGLLTKRGGTMKDSKAKLAYDTKYESSPEQIHKRSLRNQARAAYEKKHGNLPSSVDVDHIKPLGAGGTNKASNTRAISQTQNRGWRAGESGYKPKKA